VETTPTEQQLEAGSKSVHIRVLDEPSLVAQVPLSPDWPDLN
jgi:hypothetical protein